MKLRIVPLTKEEIEKSELRKLKFFYHLGRVTFYSAMCYIILWGFTQFLTVALAEEVYQIMKYFFAKIHS